jgi:hypothetical protein
MAIVSLVGRSFFIVIAAGFRPKPGNQPGFGHIIISIVVRKEQFAKIRQAIPISAND